MKTASTVLLLTATTTVLASCGADERKKGPDTRAITDVAMLDDGEDGDNNLLLDDPLKYRGYWYTYDDLLECDNENPVGEVQPIPTDYAGGGPFTMTEYKALGQMGPAESIWDDGRNDYGIRLSGGGHTLWGAGVGVGLNNEGSPAPYDLKAAGVTGVRFYIKSAIAGSEISINVRISDKYADPGQGFCSPRDEATCSVQGCHDSPSVAVPVTDEWVLQELSLDEFRREGWGEMLDGSDAPIALDPTSAIQLQFAIPNVESFDVWIDNVGLMLGDAGAVTTDDSAAADDDSAADDDTAVATDDTAAASTAM